MSKLSKEARKRLVIALTDEKAAEEVSDQIDLGVESGGVTIDDGDETAEKTWSSTKIAAEVAGAGGGGGSLTVYTDEDKPTPAEDDQWIRYNSPTAGTSLFSDGQESQSGLQWIDPGAHSEADINALYSDFGNAPQYLMEIIEAGVLDVDGSLEFVHYDSATTTIQNLIDTINVFSQAAIGKNVVQIDPGYGGVAGDLVSASLGDSTSFTESDAQPDSMYSQTFKNSKIWSIVFGTDVI